MNFLKKYIYHHNNAPFLLALIGLIYFLAGWFLGRTFIVVSVIAISIFGLAMLLLYFAPFRSRSYRMVYRAEKSMRAENYEQALVHVNKAIELRPDLPEALITRGAILLAESYNDLEAALSDFNRAIAIGGKKQHRAYHSRAFAYIQLAQYDQALQDLDAALELKPNFVAGLISRAYVYYELENYDRSIDDCTEALRISPLVTDAYVTRSAAHLKKRDFERVIHDCTQAITVTPQKYLAYNNRAIAYLMTGNVEKALSDCNIAIAYGSVQNHGYVTRATIYFVQGKYAAALADIARAKEIEPLPEVIFGEAIFSHAQGNHQHAKQCWNILIGQDQNYGDLEYIREEVYGFEPLVEEARKLIASLEAAD